MAKGSRVTPDAPLQAALKRVSKKRPAVKKIPQPKFTKDWGKVKEDTSVGWIATCSHPFEVDRPIKDTAASIQELCAKAEALLARWADLTTEAECLVEYVVEMIHKKTTKR